MKTVTDAIPVPTFEHHNICLSCGYDLFGQPRVGVCPECGQSTRESARTATFLEAPGNVARLRSGTVYLLWSSILAGFCPGICLLTMASEDAGTYVAAAFMTLIFAATAVTAGIGERRLASLSGYIDDDASNGSAWRNRPVLAFDLVAAVGLVAINIGTYAYAATRSSERQSAEYIVWGFIGAGFGCLCAGAWRAVPAYRMRMRVAEACLGGHHRGWAALGYIKAIYETAWLACSWLTLALLAFRQEDVAVFTATASLFGLGGFGILWLFMIALHIMLMVKVRRRFREGNRGFEIVAP
jgi:hypothetical protein